MIKDTKTQVPTVIDIKTEAKKLNATTALHLREMRVNNNATMRSLAFLINTPHSFIGKIEQQSRRVAIGEFIVLCKAMGRDPVVELAAIMALDLDLG